MYRLALLMFSLCFTAPLLANAQEPILEYDRDPDAVVIAVDMWSARSAGDPSDTTPDLRIYGNGRVIMHSTVNPKGQRDYETWLTDDELAEFVRFIYDNGGMEYEYGLVNEKAKEVARQSRTRRGVLDATHTEIRVFLKHFRAAGSDGPVQSDFTHRTGGYALKFQANWYPQLEEAQKLAAIEKRIVQLMRSPDLQLTTTPPAEDKDISKNET